MDEETGQLQEHLIVRRKRQLKRKTQWVRSEDPIQEKEQWTIHSISCQWAPLSLDHSDKAYSERFFQWQRRAIIRIVDR